MLMLCRQSIGALKANIIAMVQDLASRNSLSQQPAVLTSLDQTYRVHQADTLANQQNRDIAYQYPQQS